MEQEIIEVKSGETKNFGDLTITNKGGGHRMLMNADGGRGGDKSLAHIELQTPRMKSSDLKEFNMKYEGDAVTFDNYAVTIQEIMWNAQAVIFQIKKL